jgi:hypothetical protein
VNLLKTVTSKAQRGSFRFAGDTGVIWIGCEKLASRYWAVLAREDAQPPGSAEARL